MIGVCLRIIFRLWFSPCRDFKCKNTVIHTVCLSASKQWAISGLNWNHCLSQYPSVLMHFHLALLNLFSLWLKMFICLNIPSFFLFKGKFEPPSESYWDEALFKASRRNQRCFKRSFLFSSTSLFLTICFIPSVREWSEQERRELDCDVFRAAINKSVPAQALWNPEPLYPFHVFPMS